MDKVQLDIKDTGTPVIGKDVNGLVSSISVSDDEIKPQFIEQNSYGVNTNRRSLTHVQMHQTLAHWLIDMGKYTLYNVVLKLKLLVRLDIPQISNAVFW